MTTSDMYPGEVINDNTTSDDDLCHLGHQGATFCGAQLGSDRRERHGTYNGEAICPYCGLPTCPRCAQLADLERRLTRHP